MPRCPSCFTPLTRVEDEHSIRLATCSQCFGTWINAVALARLTQLDAQAPAETEKAGNATVADLAEVVSAADSKQALRCAQCEKPMVKDRFHPMIPVTIDRCNHCGFLWLDAGEMALIRKLNVELMTSTDPEIVRRREKVAEVALQWEQHKAGQGAGLGALSGGIGTTPTGPGLRLGGVGEVFDFLSYLLTRP